MVTLIFILAVLLAVFSIVAIVVANSMKRRMCIWVDRFGDVQIVASGSLGSVARDTRMVHLFLMRRVAESQSISKKVIEGRYGAEEYEIGLTDRKENQNV